MKNTIFSGIFNSDLFSAHEVLYPVQNMKSLVQLQEDLDSAISASLYKPSVSVVRFCIGNGEYTLNTSSVNFIGSCEKLSVPPSVGFL